MGQLRLFNRFGRVVQGASCLYDPNMNIAALFAPDHELAAHLLRLLDGQATDSAHDRAHLLRVWQNVRKISKIEGGDLTVLTAATLMHDFIHVPKDSPDRANASQRAADAAGAVLAALSWPEQQVSAVKHAITAHSFSAGIPPRTLEARILQDADRLDALGHIGIARCLAVSGALNRPLYDPLDPQAQSRKLDDSAYAIDHFQTKLLRLAGKFQTQTGRALADKRHAVLKQFYDGFISEVSLR